MDFQAQLMQPSPLVISGAPLSNANLLNFECNSLAGWTNTPLGYGVSTQETFGGESTFKQSSISYHSSNRAFLIKSGLYSEDNIRNVFSARIYISALLNYGNVTRVVLQVTHKTGTVYVEVYADRIRLFADAGETLIDFAFPLNEFIWLTTDVTQVGETFDLWIGDMLVAEGADCNYVTGGIGQVNLIVVDRVDDATETVAYWDKLKMGDGHV